MSGRGRSSSPITRNQAQLFDTSKTDYKLPSLAQIPPLPEEEVSPGRERSDPKPGAPTAAPGKTNDAQAQASAGISVYTPKTPLLGLKLRQLAKKQGLLPGSPRWRSYVLGTQAAARKRQREAKAKRRNKSETGVVTPVK